MNRLKGIFVLDSAALSRIYGPQERAEIAGLVDLYSQPQTRQSLAGRPDVMEQAELLFTGWGAPVLDEAFLQAAPNLKAVFFGAGAAGVVATPQAFARGIAITSAYAANAVPVAEFTLAAIIFSLKHAWRLNRELTQLRSFTSPNESPGCYGRTVGLISMGKIARILVKMLRMLDLHVLAYDPLLTDAQAGELGVERAELEQLFERSDVVSLHAPLLEETAGMIRGRHFERMRPGSTFINTARGKVVAEAEMIEVLRRRPEVFAVLDVFETEPPDPANALFDLPNVMLTPHIAGSAGQECRRMGRYMVEELRRYLAGQPMQWQITPELAARSSHRSPLTDKPTVIS